MAMSGAKVVFRRIKGRIIPIKANGGAMGQAKAASSKRRRALAGINRLNKAPAGSSGYLEKGSRYSGIASKAKTQRKAAFQNIRRRRKQTKTAGLAGLAAGIIGTGGYAGYQGSKTSP